MRINIWQNKNFDYLRNENDQNGRKQIGPLSRIANEFDINFYITKLN